MDELQQRAREMEKERSLTFLTEDEYWSLPHYGRWLLDWMARWRPKEIKRLKEEGTLKEYLTQAGEDIGMFLGDNYHTLGMSGGLEVMRDVYFGEPEQDADRYWGIPED
ncbi:MAG: hypothetical protein IJQ81_11755 [Oscillibacter sp.]|nr:hypothetical protein [Oscillibacter sp.]